MFKAKYTQGIISKSLVDDDLKTWINGFLIYRKAQGVSEGTIHFYEVKFKSFTVYCTSHQIINGLQISPNVIRENLLHLEAAGHNPDGRHVNYRAISSLLYRFEDDVETEGLKNPIK